MLRTQQLPLPHPAPPQHYTTHPHFLCQVWDMNQVGAGSGPSGTLRGMTAAVNDVAFTYDKAHVSGVAARGRGC